MTKRLPIRQGDVLLVPVESIPAKAKVKARDKGRVIIAYGEVTGHAHQIANPDSVGAEILTVGESATFIRLTKKAQLVHEEHGTLEVLPGAWEYRPQREWQYGESIKVVD